MKKEKETGKETETGKLVVNMSYPINAMRKGYVSLREQRIFITYIARINPFNPKTRTVRFTLEEFSKLCNIKNVRGMDITEYKNIAQTLLNKTVSIPLKNGGFKSFVLFEVCEVSQEKNSGQWYFEITATQTAMPWFFNMKQYFPFELQNALRLKSVNQIRLYEILKQREKIGYLDIKLIDLRELLFIKPEEYPLYKKFKQSVLDVCQKEINELTDITFTYEPKKRVGKGGRITELTFCILSKSKEETPKNDPIIIPASQYFSSIEGSPSSMPTKTSAGSGTSAKKTLKDKVNELNTSKKDPLWIYALDIATRRNNKRKLSVTPELYAIGILRNWKEAGLNTPDDLVAIGEINEQTIKDLEEPEFPESAYNIKDF